MGRINPHLGYESKARFSAKSLIDTLLTKPHDSDLIFYFPLGFINESNFKGALLIQNYAALV
uniref:Uncharacterized protein n=1 Tax=Candidatus Kentrum sp. TUN TaxID=2126343 RepID=A0A450ZT80_9GAMM|nr:MAG: hypothetical protein BECKTUN1418D_GA0071000_105710 [Candidatus Kentron sp. TUN]